MSRQDYFQACKSGDLETVMSLTNLVAPNDMDKASDMTGLMLASMQGVACVVDYLVECDGINVNVSNKYGYTALMLASRHNHLDVVDRLLVVDGIDLEAKNKAGKTAEDLAKGKARWEVVNKIQEAKKNNGREIQGKKKRGVVEKYKRKNDNVEKGTEQDSKRFKDLESKEERKIIEFSDAVHMAEVQEKLHMIKKENEAKETFTRKKRLELEERFDGEQQQQQQQQQQQYQPLQAQLKMEDPGDGSSLPHAPPQFNTSRVSHENAANQEVVLKYMPHPNGQSQQINHHNPQIINHAQIIQNNQIISDQNNYNSQMLSPQNNHNSHMISPQNSHNSQMISPQNNHSESIISPHYPSYDSSPHNASSQQASFQRVFPQEISPHYASPQQVSPHYQSPHQVSSQQVSPQPVSPAVYSQESSPSQCLPDPILAQVMARLETDLNDLHSLGKGFSGDIALARTAIGLGMAEFYDTCVNSLVNNMAVDNVLEIVKLAEESDDIGLRERAVVFVRENLRAVWAEKDWKTVMRKYPDFLLEVMDGLLSQ